MQPPLSFGIGQSSASVVDRPSLGLADITDFTNSFSILRSVIDGMEKVSESDKETFLFASFASICLLASELDKSEAQAIFERHFSSVKADLARSVRWRVLERVLRSEARVAAHFPKQLELPSSISDRVFHTFASNHPAFFNLLSPVLGGANEVAQQDKVRIRGAHKPGQNESSSIPSCSAIKIRETAPTSTCFSRNSDFVGFGFADGSIRVLRVHKRSDLDESLTVLKDNRFCGGVTCLAFDPSNKWVYSGNTSGHLIVWNHENGSCETVHQRAHLGGVSCVDGNSSGLFVSGGFDYVLRLWTRESAVAIWLQYDSPVLSVRFILDSNYIISSSNSGDLTLWSTQSRPKCPLVKVFNKKSSSVECAETSDCNRYLLTGLHDSTIDIYDLWTFKGVPFSCLKPKSEAPVVAICFLKPIVAAARSSWIVSCNADGLVCVWKSWRVLKMESNRFMPNVPICTYRAIDLRVTAARFVSENVVVLAGAKINDSR